MNRFVSLIMKGHTKIAAIVPSICVQFCSKGFVCSINPHYHLIQQVLPLVFSSSKGPPVNPASLHRLHPAHAFSPTPHGLASRHSSTCYLFIVPLSASDTEGLGSHRPILFTEYVSTLVENAQSLATVSTAHSGSRMHI